MGKTKLEEINRNIYDIKNIQKFTIYAFFYLKMLK